MKSGKLLFFAALASVWMLHSCSIATTVHFNKNYSGNYRTVVDISELIGMAGMFDTTGTSDPATMIAQLRHSMDSIGIDRLYNAMSGIHDASLDVSDEGVMTLSFDFDNLTSLNASFVSMAEHAELNPGTGDELLPMEMFSGGKQLFLNEGKSLNFTMETTDQDGGMFGGEEDAEGMDFMSSMIDYTIDLSFDRKIKSVDAQGATVLETTTNKVKTRVDMSKMMKDGRIAIKVNTK